MSNVELMERGLHLPGRTDRKYGAVPSDHDNMTGSALAVSIKREKNVRKDYYSVTYGIGQRSFYEGREEKEKYQYPRGLEEREMRDRLTEC